MLMYTLLLLVLQLFFITLKCSEQKKLSLLDMPHEIIDRIYSLIDEQWESEIIPQRCLYNLKCVDRKFLQSVLGYYKNQAETVKNRRKFWTKSMRFYNQKIQIQPYRAIQLISLPYICIKSHKVMRDNRDTIIPMIVTTIGNTNKKQILAGILIKYDSHNKKCEPLGIIDQITYTHIRQKKITCFKICRDSNQNALYPILYIDKIIENRDSPFLDDFYIHKFESEKLITKMNRELELEIARNEQRYLFVIREKSKDFMKKNYKTIIFLTLLSQLFFYCFS